MKRVLVTGGAGFIGSALVRALVGQGYDVLNVDALTYAGNLASLADIAGANNYRFERADICDGPAMRRLVAEFGPQIVTHLAAESHVDRSLDGPGAFVETNVTGTFHMLQAARAYWQGLGDAEQAAFRFHHISTDEVFGALGDDGAFCEDTPYDPRSPYSASKAASDHLVRAWHHSFGLPVLVTNCSNNYGPRQFPEKLIPLVILKAIAGEPLPVYGQGLNVRDWLHVEDHATALIAVFERGQVGETYLIGGRSERRNIDVVHAICDALDRARPRGDGTSYRGQIAFVADRPGHDFRYAIDAARIEHELGWRPAHSFEQGIAATVDWYLANEGWWRPILDGAYAGERLGLA